MCILQLKLKHNFCEYKKLKIYLLCVPEAACVVKVQIGPKCNL